MTVITDDYDDYKVQNGKLLSQELTTQTVFLLYKHDSGWQRLTQVSAFMSRQFDAGTIQGFWTDIQKATLAQSAQPAGGQVAQRVQQLPSADSPNAQAARSALLASLTAAGLISQTGFPMYPPPQFDSGNLTPQALSRVDDMLPIGAQQLQQPQSAGQLQASAGRIDSAEAVTAQLPIVQPPVPHASGSESDDDARGRTAAANGDRKSQLKEKNRKAQKRFRERQKVRTVLTVRRSSALSECGPFHLNR